jgi:ubiquitin-protein ligase E3 A
LDLSDSQYRKQLKIHFLNEEGVDEGGLLKEFFLLVSREIFNESRFEVLNETILWFPRIKGENSPRHFYILGGIIVALAIYNGVQLDISFPLALYKRILGLDFLLKDFDPVLYQNIVNFHSGEELDRILEEYRNNLLNNEFLELFISGFKQVFNFGSVLYNFSPKDLDQLLRGKELVDLHKLKDIVSYQGGFSPDTPLVIWLWEILLDEFNDLQKKKFFHFVTGSDRAPVGGIESLKFTIYRCSGDANRFPTSQTCFNTLLLNEYDSKEKLKKYLTLAIEHYQGFGLC